jgi:hypothetical protein
MGDDFVTGSNWIGRITCDELDLHETVCGINS